MRSKILPLLLAHVESTRGGIASFLAEQSLPADAHTREELALPLSRFRELTSRLAELAGDPFLGLHAAMALRPGAYGAAEFLVRSAATARDALRQVARFEPLFNSLIHLSLIENDDTAAVTCWTPGEPMCLGREGNEFTLAAFVAIGRQMAGEDWAPDDVSFAHHSSEGVEELARFFGCRSISFETGYLSLRLKTRDLARPVRTGDGALHEFLERRARALLPKSTDDGLDAIREAIRLTLPSEPSLAEVARALGVTPRTLQRRLAERDTSFRGIVDGVRQAFARENLDDGSRSLKEIAGMLGYVDARAFGRAYKRWTGRTPRQSDKQGVQSVRRGS